MRVFVSSSYAIIVLLTLSIFIGSLTSASQYLFFALSILAPAVMLAKKRLPDYIIFCVVLFFIAPFVRRLVDFQLGFSSISLIMLTPYMASLLSIPALIQAVSRSRSSFPLPFILVLASALYGYLLALIEGRFVASTFDFLRWTLPPCVALLIAFSPDHKPEILSKLTNVFLIFIPIISLYGCYQFLSVPLWDALWMINSQITSIGLPVPYQIRVFSILNSPGSCGVILMFGILLCYSAKGILARFVVPALGTVGLGLTLFRSAWISLAFGLAYIAWLGPMRTRITLLVSLLLVIFAAPTILVITGSEAVIAQRLDTLFNLNNDASTIARSAQYDQFLEQITDNPLGVGFGVGFYGGKAGEGNVNIIDSGFVEIFFLLGSIFGTLYLTSFLYVSGLSIAARAGPQYTGCKAAIVGYLPLLWSATATAGEMGFMLWLAVGLLMPMGLKKSSQNLELSGAFRSLP